MSEIASTHEAAHLAACLSFGLLPSAAEINSGGGGLVRADWNKLNDRQNLLIALVGDTAVAMLTDHSESTVSPEDWQLASPGASRFYASMHSRHARNEIDRQLSLMVWELRPAIECLKSELIRRRKLNSHDLAALVHTQPALRPFRNKIPKPTAKRRASPATSSRAYSRAWSDDEVDRLVSETMSLLRRRK